jgi:organic hydroperoxide reductase OsmC/OhrA
VATVKPKEFAYLVGIDRDGRMSAEGEPASLEPGDEWTPDHLLLAAVVRCSLVSLAFHARRIGVDVAASSGAASGRVTKPEGEERYRFVEVDVELDVTLDPRPEADALAELIERAERDCFVGASLVVKPTYRWNVA